MYPLMFVVGFVGGWIGTLAFSWRFSRRCTNLEFAIGDLQQRASTFKGKEMAEKRWSKEKAFDAEMAQLLQTTPASPRRKFDNDPLGE